MNTPKVIFTGRFQPFHSGHYARYKRLVNQYGRDNVYISTSDSTDPRESPLNFDDKKKIITTMFGIDPDHILKVHHPFSAKEYMPYFSPETPVIWAVGAKDSNRVDQFIANTKGYFSQLPKNGELDGFVNHAYIVAIPPEPTELPISGTDIRKVFSTGSDEDKRKVFMQIYGKDNPEIFELLSHKIRPPSRPAVNPARGVQLQPFLKVKIRNPETDRDIYIATALQYGKGHPAYQAAMNFLRSKKVVESVLLEGGAYGGILHPYEDLNLTFGDLKNMVKKSLGSGLGDGGPVREKTDGQNLMFTVKNGELRFARRQKQLANFGDDAMSIDDIKGMYAKNLMLYDVFGKAADDITSAIKAIPKEKIDTIFRNGRGFASVEILHPKSENVVPYGQRILVIHGVRTVDEAGETESEDDGKILTSAIRDAQAENQSEFGIRSQNVIVFSDAESDEQQAKIGKYLEQLDKLESEYGLSDESTIGEFKQARRLKAGKKMEDEMYPLELLVARLGVDTMLRSTNLMSLQNPKAGQLLKKKILDAIKEVRASKDPVKLARLQKNLKWIGDIGSRLLPPVEGLLFTYNGQLYKYNGAFTPINRVIQLAMRDKFRDKPVAEPITAQPAGELPTQDSTVDIAAPEMPIRQDMLMRKVRNPETGNEILIKTALDYPKDHPAYLAAKRMLGESLLIEGGHQFPQVNSAIPAKLAPSVIKKGFEALGGEFPYSMLGSTHKEYMGDLDVGLDTRDFAKVVGMNFEDNPKEYWNRVEQWLKQNMKIPFTIQKGFNQFSVLVPMVDDTGRQIGAINPDGTPTGQPGMVQIDFHVGNRPWMEKVLSGAPESIYKAAHRNALLQAIVGQSVEQTGNQGVLRKLIFDRKNGFYDATYTEPKPNVRNYIQKKLITTDPDKMISYVFGPGIKWDDVNTFEKMHSAMQLPNFRFKGKEDGIYKEFRQLIHKKKIAMPSEVPPAPEEGPAAAHPEYLDKTILNPITKRYIKIASALGYPEGHPAYIAAKKELERLQQMNN